MIQTVLLAVSSCLYAVLGYLAVVVATTEENGPRTQQAFLVVAGFFGVLALLAACAA